jgi:lipid A 3-O-deacylase
MKKIMMTSVCLLMFNTLAFAHDSEFGVSLGIGKSNNDIDFYRVGLVKKWDVRWLENQNRTGYLDGYFELSFNRWHYNDDKINGIALSPVFQYMFNPYKKDWYPYLEGGIGVAYLDSYEIKGRDLSSHFQFEDRIGVGLRFKKLDLSFRYMHYSNASIKGPNDGVDILMGNIAWFF